MPAEKVDRVLRALEAAPHDAGAGAARAQLLLALKRFDVAAVAFSALHAARPSTPGPAVGLARSLAGAQRWPESVTAYQTAVALETSPRARLTLIHELADVAKQAGRSDVQIEALRLALRAAPHDRGAALALADALVGAGEDEDAEILLREAALTAADAGALWSRLLQICRARDTLPQLESTLQQSIGGGRGRASTWRALGLVRRELGDFEGAHAALERARALAPADRALLHAFDQMAVRSGRSHHARIAPPTAGTDDLDEQFRSGEKDEARRQFDLRLRSARHDLDRLIGLADLASRFGDDVRVLACWDAVLALSPADERGILGLGEAHFQAGRRELAKRTWSRLLTAISPRAEAHERLAEVLGDHDFVDEAIVEARAAGRLEPDSAKHRRTLARILERKRDIPGAIAEWRAVIAKSLEPNAAADRREARSRLIALLTREGRTRLASEAESMRDYVRRHPGDREAVLALSDLELRLQDSARAQETLRAAAQQNPADAEVVLALVRLLRQDQSRDEAVYWLRRLADETPSRAFEVHLQRAEIELARYQDEAALAAATDAASVASDAAALGRVAALQERAGDDQKAAITYGRALALAVSERTARSLYELRARQGDVDAGLRMLLDAGRAASDPETQTELFARALDAAELTGAWAKVERAVALTMRAGGPEEGRLMVGLLQRTLLLERPSDARRARLARLALRPLLDLISEPGLSPDPKAVDLLGRLRDRHAVPILIRAGEDAQSRMATKASAPSAKTALAATLVALGRLGDERARPLCLAAAAPGSPEMVRAAALWALGRMPGRETPPLLLAATADDDADLAALACLALGRHGGEEATRRLAEVAGDTHVPALVRRAAIVGLALTKDPRIVPRLADLLERAPAELTATLAEALGTLADSRAVSPLLALALTPRPGLTNAGLDGLRLLAEPMPLPDEADALGSGPIDVTALVDAALPKPSPQTDLRPLVREHASAFADAVTAAFADPLAPARLLTDWQHNQDSVLLLGPAAPGLGVELARQLRRLMSHPDPQVRRPAVVLACRFGLASASPALVADLVRTEALDPTADRQGNPGAAAVEAATCALRTSAPAAVEAAVRPLTGSSDWAVRMSALHVLTKVRASRGKD